MKSSREIKAKALCIITRNGNEILVGIGYDRVKDEKFGRLIGGTVEFGEKSKDTVRRELMEELGAEIENLEFIQTIENVFILNGEQGHQIMFVYKGDFSDKKLYKKDQLKILDKENVFVVWLPLNKVESGEYKLYPEMDYKKLLSK